MPTDSTLNPRPAESGRLRGGGKRVVSGIIKQETLQGHLSQPPFAGPFKLW